MPPTMGYQAMLPVRVSDEKQNNDSIACFLNIACKKLRRSLWRAVTPLFLNQKISNFLPRCPIA
jgi:hypothetical protein